MRQHLAALNAAAAIGDAVVSGNAIGSPTVSFSPRGLRAGRFRFAVGSAGSATLVCQTLLPALMLARDPSELVLEGGTHNPHAPTFDFLDRAFLAAVRRMGVPVRAELDAPGFYPAGGGRFRIRISPAASPAPLHLAERGRTLGRRAKAVVSRLPLSIARRELAVVADALGWPPDTLTAEAIPDGRGPGNVLSLEIETEAVTEVFTGFGVRGVPAETVALGAAREAKEYLDSGMPVGRHLADQLPVPMALLAGGVFRTLAPTGHTRTNIEVIRRFLGARVDLERENEDRWSVSVRAHRVGRRSSPSPH
jgi:RNA 3'-terminal phosphate cyclase (ATP)